MPEGNRSLTDCERQAVVHNAADRHAHAPIAGARSVTVSANAGYNVAGVRSLSMGPT